jgi:hypothetical protein
MANESNPGSDVVENKRGCAENENKPAVTPESERINQPVATAGEVLRYVESPTAACAALKDGLTEPGTKTPCCSISTKC